MQLTLRSAPRLAAIALLALFGLTLARGIYQHPKGEALNQRVRQALRLPENEHKTLVGTVSDVLDRGMSVSEVDAALAPVHEEMEGFRWYAAPSDRDPYIVQRLTFRLPGPGSQHVFVIYRNGRVADIDSREYVRLGRRLTDTEARQRLSGPGRVPAA